MTTWPLALHIVNRCRVLPTEAMTLQVVRRWEGFPELSPGDGFTLFRLHSRRMQVRVEFRVTPRKRFVDTWISSPALQEAIRDGTLQVVGPVLNVRWKTIRL
ncbi:MAG TPA: hypothetical protein VJO33_06670 [Gemmatimonadaceae bacterium]|nr:hypothetical protein [Gemmatimonadaceae bacterium]